MAPKDELKLKVAAIYDSPTCDLIMLPQDRKDLLGQDKVALVNATHDGKTEGAMAMTHAMIYDGTVKISDKLSAAIGAAINDEITITRDNTPRRRSRR